MSGLRVVKGFTFISDSTGLNIRAVASGNQSMPDGGLVISSRGYGQGDNPPLRLSLEEVGELLNVLDALTLGRGDESAGGLPKGRRRS